MTQRNKPKTVLRSFLLNWLSAQYGQEVKSRIYEAAADALGGVPADDSPADGVTRAAIGLVFARSAEYGCLADRLEGIQTTKGNGLRFTQGTYQKTRIAIVETGENQASIREGTLALLQVFRPQKIIAAGFAAALTPEIKQGEIYVPLELISETGQRLNLAASSSASPVEQSGESDSPFRTAPMVSVTTIPAEPRKRRAVHEKSGAGLSDTSAWHVARVCREASIPILVVKVVSDRFGDLPPNDLRRAVQTEGQSTARRLGALFGTLTNRPSSLLDLHKIKERQLEMADRLADALTEIFAQFPQKGAQPY